MSVCTQSGNKPVDNQCGECLAVYILCHNEQWLSLRVGQLQHRQNLLNTRYLLLTEQDECIFKLNTTSYRAAEETDKNNNFTDIPVKFYIC